MRKLLLSFVCMAFMAGLAFATEYTIVSYDKDKKVVTLKDGDKEVTGKLTDKTKVTRVVFRRKRRHRARTGEAHR